MKLRRPFVIRPHGAPAPASRRTVYCDGAAESGFREGVDLELSHWLPNRTPAAYRADTSTDICMRWAADGAPGDFELAVNNHVDCDGVLSVLVAVAPEFGLAHRETLVGAAEIGDFWGHAGIASQAVYEGLAVLMQRLEHDGADPQTIYARCIDAVEALVAPGASDRADVAPGLAALARSDADIESGAVRTVPVAPGFVRFEVPRAVTGDRLAAALRAPAFNVPLAGAGPIHPHARNRRHREDVHLVSVEMPGGWSHEVWLPGYAWAEAVTVRRPPALVLDDDYEFRVVSPALDEGLAALSRDERAAGVWVRAQKVSAFSGVPGRDFPIVVSFLAPDRTPAASSQTPAAVGRRLAPAFTIAAA